MFCNCDLNKDYHLHARHTNASLDIGQVLDVAVGEHRHLNTPPDCRDVGPVRHARVGPLLLPDKQNKQILLRKDHEYYIKLE